MPHNPYSPPTAQVDGVEENTPFDFSESVGYSFTPRQLWWAGVCCILGIVLTFPMLYFGYMETINPIWNYASLSTIYIATFLTIYVYIIFKKILTEKSLHCAANLAISLYIISSVISALMASLADDRSNTSLFTSPLWVAEYVISGLIHIYLGIKLLRCEDLLFGLSKTIAYLSIAVGITTASVVLVPIGLFVSIALEISMALMFFRASKALTKVQS